MTESDTERALRERLQKAADEQIKVGDTVAAPKVDELAKAAADRVREAAERAKAEGRMGGTRKAAGPEPRPAQGLPIPTVMGLLHHMLQSLAQTIDACDSHFMQNPLFYSGSTAPRHLLPTEVELLAKRRHAMVVVRQIRDSAEVLLLACGDGPQPFARP